MANSEISKLLRDYQQLKRNTRDIREGMLKIVVEELGVAEKAVRHSNLETFLDGYLVGQQPIQSSGKMTNYEISGLLSSCRQVKQDTRALRVKMLQVAINELGMEQNEALQANLEVFLDGYLVGQGMMQSWRKTGT